VLIVSKFDADDSHLCGPRQICALHAGMAGLGCDPDVVGLHLVGEAQEDGFVL
jgi:hypothetical protein